MTKFEVKQGGLSNTVRATIGFVIGFATGAIVGGPLWKPEEKESECNELGEHIPCELGNQYFGNDSAGPGLYLAIPSAIIGAVIAERALPAERWEPVPLPLQVGVSPRGARVAMRFEFGK